MNARNASRELRRATAKRNAIANEIAETFARSMLPNRRLVAEWEMATMRLYALQKNLRPRECGVPLGEGKTNGTHNPAVESGPLTAPPDAAPESGTSSKTQPNTEP